MDENGDGVDSPEKTDKPKTTLNVVSLRPKKDVPLLTKVKELIDEAVKTEAEQPTHVAIIILSGPEHLSVRPITLGPTSSVAVIGLLEVSKHLLMQNNIDFE